MARDNMTRPRRAPLVPACKLFPKESMAGLQYMAGRLGGLRVLIMPKPEDEPGEHTHNLLITDAMKPSRDGAA